MLDVDRKLLDDRICHTTNINMYISTYSYNNNNNKCESRVFTEKIRHIKYILNITSSLI